MTPNIYETSSSQIPLFCRKLYDRGFIAGSDGNVSEKTKKGIVITPSGVDKSEIEEKDLCRMNFRGEVLKGSPSTEKFMHLSIYQQQEKAQAVIHAHPPAAIALSLARPDWENLPLALPEIVIALGKVPFVPYSRPGTEELAEVLKPFVIQSKALILAHHGAVVWGENLKETYMLMEQLEHSCRILCLSESMGKTTCLSEQEIQKLQLKYCP